MRIAVASDIHSTADDGSDVPDGLIRLCNGADRIVACGDHTGGGGLDRLAAVAPLTATVNPAMPDDGAGRASGETALVTAGDQRIGVLFSLARIGIDVSDEGAISWPAWPIEDRLADAFGGPIDVLLFGGTHQPLVARSSGVLLVNPGSPRFAARTTAAVLHVHDESPVTTVEIVDV